MLASLDCDREQGHLEIDASNKRLNRFKFEFSFMKNGREFRSSSSSENIRSNRVIRALERLSLATHQRPANDELENNAKDVNHGWIIRVSIICIEFRSLALSFDHLH